MWGEHGDRPTPRPETAGLFGSWSVTEALQIGCDVESAWKLLTDVSRIGEFSPECVAAHWVDEPPRRVGSRFQGTNLTMATGDKGPYELEWTRPCVVTAWDPPTRFSYTVGDRYDGTPAAEWELVIEPTVGGCWVSQTFRHLPDGLSGPRHWADADPTNAQQIIADRSVDLATSMRTTLLAMKQVLER